METLDQIIRKIGFVLLAGFLNISCMYTSSIPVRAYESGTTQSEAAKTKAKKELHNYSLKICSEDHYIGDIDFHCRTDEFSLWINYNDIKNIEAFFISATEESCIIISLNYNYNKEQGFCHPDKKTISGIANAIETLKR